MRAASFELKVGNMPTINCPRGRAPCLYLRGTAFAAVLPNSAMAKGQGTRWRPTGTMEPRHSAMGSPLPALPIDCVAPDFAGFDSGRALLAGGAMGMRGDRGEGARRPDGDAW